MSAIAGIINFSGQAPDLSHLRSMTSALRHRGPDSSGEWTNGGAALSQCMLHTTPESLREVQPLVSSSGCVLVMDGRLDNWEALREQLNAPQATDAELALLAYDTWGADCFGRFDGDFAVAVWDPRQQTLHCARDIFGRRPFYYYWDGECFAFASELKPLLDLPWVPRQLNEGMVAEWLGHEWYSRVETFWQGILRLEPAHRLVADKHGIHSEKHWEPDLFSPIHYDTDEEYSAHYRQLYNDCVRKISRSHLPVAYEVSGGLDSSAAYAVAVQLQRRGLLLAPTLQGYTLAFPPGSPAYELDYAHAVARHNGTTLEECAPALRPLQWYLQRAADRADLPDIPNGTMVLTLHETARDRGARVIVGGLGGDEYTGVGTDGMYYADLLSERQWRGVGQAIRRDLPTLGLWRTAWWVLRQGLAPLLPATLKQVVRRIKPAPTLSPYWLSPGMKATLARRQVPHAGVRDMTVARYSQRRILRFYEHVELHHMMELSDYRGAHCGIEGRSPYYNKSMLQFALSTGEWLRQRGTQHRWLHRHAMRDVLPEVVLNRNFKADFGEIVFRTNGEVRGDYLAALLARRSAWLDDGAIAKLKTYTSTPHEINFLDWIVWNLMCCDAVAASPPSCSD
jgi:asparagine synthase (glutamine-hydrolysing)